MEVDMQEPLVICGTCVGEKSKKKGGNRGGDTFKKKDGSNRKPMRKSGGRKSKKSQGFFGNMFGEKSGRRRTKKRSDARKKRKKKYKLSCQCDRVCKNCGRNRQRKTGTEPLCNMKMSLRDNIIFCSKHCKIRSSNSKSVKKPPLTSKSR